MSNKNNPFRDGELHVLSEKCSTCIFRPGNPMQLKPGRLKGITEDALAEDSFIVCHQTLDSHIYGTEPAVCRGFGENYSTNSLRIAERLGIVTFDDPPKKEKS